LERTRLDNYEGSDRIRWVVAYHAMRYCLDFIIRKEEGIYRKKEDKKISK
jgi:hypothetical protein